MPLSAPPHLSQHRRHENFTVQPLRLSSARGVQRLDVARRRLLGTYILGSNDGRSVPYQANDDDGTWVFTVLSGQVTLKNDQSYNQSFRLIYAGSPNDTSDFLVHGTYSGTGHTYSFFPSDGQGEGYPGTLYGRALTIATLRYMKQ